MGQFIVLGGSEPVGSTGTMRLSVVPRGHEGDGGGGSKDSLGTVYCEKTSNIRWCKVMEGLVNKDQDLK